MEIIGYIAAIFVGITLGLVGSGGFLALPILVYLFHIIDPEIATAYSLFLVGVVSFVGVFLKNKQGYVNYKTAIYFGVPTVIAIFLTRKFLMPAIPETIFSINQFVITKRLIVMSLLAITMMISSYFMIGNKKTENELPLNKKNKTLNFLGGMIIGSLSGIVGIGGGFVIVPALLKIGNLPMKMAVGTSLLIVALNSAFGFLGSVSHFQIDWKLLILFSLFSVLGMLIGNYISKNVNGKHLKLSFGWFVLLTGAVIMINELFFTNF
ncbi:MAG: sulfite exporter TauE/SafE family protein [Vicingaceae bacterium]|nr:sulfite exporter TauE/SafE family protein [Vicingaceae bacterium]